MSFPILRSRICRLISTTTANPGYRRLLCTSPPKEPPLSSSSSAAPLASEYNAQSSAASASQPPSTPPPPQKKQAWKSFLKFGIFGALTGVAATAGYATYAYSLEEVDEKTKAIRSSANFAVGGDASTFDRVGALFKSSAMAVPVKAIELYLDLRRTIEGHVKDFADPSSDKLLPDLHPSEQHVFTLVLDLNETLVYSDWKRDRGWRTFKRPGVDAFLEHLGQFYEIVIYSDQLQMYVQPVVDRLNEKLCIRHSLSRDATKYQNGKHYRDLSKLNRDPAHVIYVGGHAREHCLQPENCVEVKPWTSEDMNDTSLVDLIPFFEYVARNSPRDIRPVLASYEGRDVAKEFIERTKEHNRRVQEQKRPSLWRR